MRFLLPIPLLGLVFAALADIERDPSFTVYGLGISSCRAIVDAGPDGPPAAAVASWVFGYITAVGMEYAFDTDATVELDATDEGEMMDWVHAYCRDNRDKDLTDAGFYLAMALLKPKSE